MSRLAISGLIITTLCVTSVDEASAEQGNLQVHRAGPSKKLFAAIDTEGTHGDCSYQSKSRLQKRRADTAALMASMVYVDWGEMEGECKLQPARSPTSGPRAHADQADASAPAALVADADGLALPADAPTGPLLSAPPAPQSPAEPAAAPAPTTGDKPRLRPSLLATAAAIGPGFFYHGLGARIAGDRQTARRLLYIQGATFGSVLAGGIILGATGAPGEIARPLIPALLGLSGGMLINWVAGIYGAAGGPRLGGSPRLDLPRVQAQLSYIYIDEPQFAYTHFANLGVDVRHRRWRARVDSQLAADDDNQRVRAAVGYRFYGPIHRPGASAGCGFPALDPSAGCSVDGSYLEVEVGAVNHDFGDDLFRRRSYQVVASGRYDLRRVSPALDGAFGEVILGLALDSVDYRIEGISEELASQLLGGFAFGMYLGHPSRRFGQVRLFYDHSRDGFVGTMASKGGGNGFLGSFGLDGQLFFTRRLGATFKAHAGSAYLFDVGLLFQMP